MKGLEIAKNYYEEYGKDMIKAILGSDDIAAVGLVGEGSECLGFDDEISKDHDYDGGFMVFLPDSYKGSDEFYRLKEEYEKIRNSFLQGSARSLYGDGRRGVFLVGDFYESLIGTRDGMLNDISILLTPDYCMCNATNGEIFCEGEGTFVKIRERLLKMPSDVRLKKMAARAGYMAQYGQYNYIRAVRRGELEVMNVCTSEFIKQAAWMCYLLEGRYSPYYKWMFRGLDDLSDIGRSVREKIRTLLQMPVDKRGDIIEEICIIINDRLRAEGLSDERDEYMERQGLSIMKRIADERIRAMHLLQG